MSQTRGRRLRRACLAGLVCFGIHLGLTGYHLYFTASDSGARTFPHPRSIAEPRRWHDTFDLNRWDSAHYERIVLEGYRNPREPTKPLSTILWYPGYPLLAKAIFKGTGSRVTLIFSALSVAFTAAFWLLLWSPGTTSRLGTTTVTAASVLILSWPGAFWWFAGMTEPLTAVLLLGLLRLWWAERPAATATLLAYATAVKQIFVPAVLAIFVLDLLRNPGRPWLAFARGIVSMTGFVAFGFYCWLSFGNFFTSSDLALATYQKQISLLSLIDVGNYLAHLGRPGGATAAASMSILLLFALRLPGIWRDWRRSVAAGRAEVPNDFALWWLALAITSFSVIGEAYGADAFGSMLRYQTANIPIFLLAAYTLRRLAPWQAAALLAAPAAVLLYWQNDLAARYWSWDWLG